MLASPSAPAGGAAEPGAGNTRSGLTKDLLSGSKTMADASGNTLSLPSRNLCSRRGLLAATPALALAGGGAGGGGGGVPFGPDEPLSPAWHRLDAIHRMLTLDFRDPALDEPTIEAIDAEGEAARKAIYALKPTGLADAVAMLLTLAAVAEEPLGSGDVALLLAVVGWLTRGAPHVVHADLARQAVTFARGQGRLVA
jgi:hypothetical protein